MQRKSGVREPVDLLIADLARQQHGVVSRAQLVGIGLGVGAIEYRVRTGSLHRIHAGVYAVGHRAPAALAAEMAAVLACGEGAVVSHGSAGFLWGILERKPGRVHVTRPGRDRDQSPGFISHSTSVLAPHDVREIGGVPVTSPARTVLDLAAVLAPADLEQVAALAQVRRLVRRRDLVEQLKRNTGRRGAGRLRALLDLDHDPARTRSRTERRVLQLLAAAGLPRPDVNARVDGYEVDFLWREQRLVVEYDGWATHASRRSFESDRDRDTELQLAGFRVIRITWRQLRASPDRIVGRIARALTAT